MTINIFRHTLTSDSTDKSPDHDYFGSGVHPVLDKDGKPVLDEKTGEPKMTEDVHVSLSMATKDEFEKAQKNHETHAKNLIAYRHEQDVKNLKDAGVSSEDAERLAKEADEKRKNDGADPKDENTHAHAGLHPRHGGRRLDRSLANDAAARDNSPNANTKPHIHPHHHHQNRNNAYTP